MRVLSRFVVAVALLGTASVAGAACGSAGSEANAAPPACRDRLTDARYARAAATVRPLVRRLHGGLRAPGLQVAVAIDGDVVWRVACGLADVSSKRPVTETTRFRIGSVTKPLTAVALARLAEERAVDVDAPIQRYVPGFPRKGNKITLRELGGHLAGIRHYESPAEVVNRRHFASLTDALAVFANDQLVAEPRFRFSYSSFGFVLIGAALEAAARDRYDSLMQGYVLRPSGLTHTSLATKPVPSRATFYDVRDDAGYRRAPPIDLSDRLPAAGYLSTASDLSRFGSLVAGPRLLSPASRTLLFAAQKTKSGAPTGYGVGFEIHPSRRGLFVGHTGSVDGGTAAILIHLASHAAIGLTTNLGYVTAASPPPPAKGTPDPPALLIPFIEATR
jgi:serine beta-lactamase-like protein LACTB, mitochondrial